MGKKAVAENKDWWLSAPPNNFFTGRRKLANIAPKFVKEE
jgi:hypothetical protein